MAQLAIAAAGAALGGTLGAGVGFASLGVSIGWAAGGILGGTLFPQKLPDGSRLGDLTVQSSALGSPIPILYGTGRMAGNIIWSTGLIERSRNVRVGKGGGSRQKVYEYSSSWAVALCEGVAMAPVRIWFDDRLVYDASGASVQLQVPGLRFRFYPGNETQLPDPAIVANVGEENAPAYRGISYLLFDDVPLDKTGNRIPNVTVEISANAPPSVHLDSLNQPPPIDGANGMSTKGAVDFTTRQFYYVTGSLGASPNRVFETDYVLRTSRILPATIAPRSNLGVVVKVPGGLLVGQSTELDGSRNLLAGWNTVTGVREWLGPAAMRGSQGYGCVVRILGGEGRIIAVLSAFQDPFNENPLGLPTAVDARTGAFLFGDQHAVWPSSFTPGTPGDSPIYSAIVAGRTGIESSECFYLHRLATQELELWRFTFSAAAGNLGTPTWQPVGVTATLVDTLDHTDFDLPTLAGIDPRDMQYDPTDDTLIIAAGASDLPVSASVAFIKYRPGTGRLWVSSQRIFVGPSNGFNPRVSLTRNILVTTSPTELHSFDTRTGEYLGSPVASPNLFAMPRFFFDSELMLAGSHNTRIILERVSAGTVTLESVVRNLCGRVGLGPSDLALSALSDTMIRGYVITRNMTARDAIAQLSTGFLFDMIESDDTMKAVNRGGAAGVSLAYGDMVRAGETVTTEDRVQEMEVPVEMTVRYLDINRNYEPGAQTVQRPTAPTPVARSLGKGSIDLAIPFTAGEARSLAARILFGLWRQRQVFKFAGSAGQLRLEPTDVVTFTAADGRALRLRITQADLGADWTVRFEATAEDAGDYTVTLPADDGRYFQRAMPVPYRTEGMLPVMPLLDDFDDGGALALTEYASAGGFTAAWGGASVLATLDGVTWTGLGLVDDAPAWGAAITALGAPTSPFSWDEINTLDVQMFSGAPDSDAELDVLNGANVGVLFRAGVPSEVIQWQNAASLGAGAFRLSRLLRGRRGSEDGCGSRAVGDMFLAFPPGDDRLTLRWPLARLNQSVGYRFQGAFDAFDALPILPRVVTGRAEQPYAPVHIAGARDGSNNLTITWQRRTRLAGDWRDGTGAVPLGEDSEAYEVDILDGADVVRTIAGLSAGTASYTAAEQTADGLTPGGSVDVRVYQISARVGRGIAGSATV